MTKQRILAAVREICLAFPEASERPSRGEPTFFIGGKRSFATVWDDHHGDGRFALLCAAPAGQSARLDRDEIAAILEEAFAEVAPAKLLKAARPRRE